MYQCRSGKHHWTRLEDAQHCCNGFQRCLGIRQYENDGKLFNSMYRYWKRDDSKPVDTEFTPGKIGYSDYVVEGPEK